MSSGSWKPLTSRASVCTSRRFSARSRWTLGGSWSGTTITSRRSSMRPIKPMPAQAGTTTHLDIIDKLNEVIDRLNYITRRDTPLMEGEATAMGAKWRADPQQLKGVLEELEARADQALRDEGIEPYSSFIKRADE